MSTFNKKHHYLVAAEVVFLSEEEGEHPNAIRLNAVLAQEDKALPVKSIGRAQQAVQLNFFKRMNDAKIQVLDVVIISFSYLGHMSEKEFQKVPEGHQLAERVQDPMLQ